MTIRAKFKVIRTAQVKSGDRILHEVEMAPVYSADPESENKKFWDATPTGNFKMQSILVDAFDLDGEYYLDFTPA